MTIFSSSIVVENLLFFSLSRQYSVLGVLFRLCYLLNKTIDHERCTKPSAGHFGLTGGGEGAE